jgi:uncharacterized protein (TIGR03066 family)
MRALSTALLLASAALVAAFSGNGLIGAQNDSNAEKIVGVWEVTKSATPAPPGATLEFTKDGKLKFRAEVKGKAVEAGGTYKVQGNKLQVAFKAGTQEKQETLTIKTLTDSRLVLEEPKGMVDEYKRKK